MLRENEHRNIGMSLLDPVRRPDALVAVARWHADVDHRQIGIVLADRPAKRVRVADRGHHLVAGIPEEASQPLPQQDLVLGDNYLQGSSATRRVPLPGALLMSRRPPSAATLSTRPARPEPATGAAPPRPSSEISTVRLPLERAALINTLEAPACLTEFVSASLATK